MNDSERDTNMVVKVLSTGSVGNCYILDDGNSKLILDAGVPCKDIIKALGYSLMNVSAALITHKHRDHFCGATDLFIRGIDVFTGFNVKIPKIIKDGLKALAFAVPHDDEPCVGYYIEFGGQKLLYITDFEYVPFTFQTHPIDTMII